MKGNRLIQAGFAAALLALSVSGCRIIKQEEFYNRDIKVEGAEGGFKTSPLGNRYIEAVAFNEGQKTYSFAMADIALFDASGARIGYTHSAVYNLAPGARQKFEAFFLKEGVASYKIEGFEGFAS